MKSYKEIKKKLLKDVGVRKAYKELGPEFELAKSIIEMRIKKGLTQAVLAKKIGTKQSAIARLESGYNPSMVFGKSRLRVKCEIGSVVVMMYYLIKINPPMLHRRVFIPQFLPIIEKIFGVGERLASTSLPKERIVSLLSPPLPGGVGTTVVSWRNT